MISAKIIADSKNEFGDRITTFVCTFPRIILAELNTHRMFSRNSASSRAIPFEKMLKMVQENPFIPIKWMKDHSGMQGSEFFTDEDLMISGITPRGANQPKKIDILKMNWLNGRDFALDIAKSLSNKGLTKQICNRLLEPFMWHTAIITATDFENFFALRNHEAAEIHLQELARVMLLAYNDSQPRVLKGGEWHIPFGDKINEVELFNLFNDSNNKNENHNEYLERQNNEINISKIKIATARCARVSYINHDGTSSYEADIKMHDRLAVAGHWSAFEHCAKSMNNIEYDRYYLSTNGNIIDGVCGNFKGFIQYRKMFENENRKDSRVIKK